MSFILMSEKPPKTDMRQDAPICARKTIRFLGLSLATEDAYKYDELR
jgi:hypothetical protein